MRVLSLFSGVGGFDLGLERAGIETVLQVEIDPFCRSVLARHWPHVERLEDVRDVGVGRARDLLSGQSLDAPASESCAEWRGGDVDLVHGGFPCQPFSVAGQRAGDRDDRYLWPEFRRVLRELRPRWALLENVPGLLSIDSGRLFGSILADLDELGFDAAWAVLDAQHFGVPQRRRRVFVVAGPRGRGAEQVLSLCESCGGNPETGGTAREDVAYALAASARGTGDGHGNAWNSTYVANAISASAGHHGHSSPHGDGSDNLVIPIQDAREVEKQQNGLGIGAPGEPMFTVDAASRHAVHIPEIVGQAVNAKWAKGSSGPAGDETHNMVSLGVGVRRLTPRECERLMGWPDDWTRWDAAGKEIADSHRYRMVGNGVVASVAEWVGHRLVAVDALLREAVGEEAAIAT